MPPGFRCVRKRALLALALLAAAAAVAHAAVAADDASAGYRAIRPSLVKVWAFDAAGRPTASGTGIVVGTSEERSEVLTAAHVVAGAARVRIDVSREEHDLPARVERTGSRDLALLEVDAGELRPARFAAPSRAVVEGNVVAIAGYVKNDELIGVAGQEPRVLFPATVSARPDDGAYLELDNVHVEEGLSGGPVFDPQSGDVLGVVTSRTTDARGGFADSGALVVLPFLGPQRVASAAPMPSPLRMPVVVVPPARVPGPAFAAWQAADQAPKRFAFVRAGCTTAVVIGVRTLQFAIAHGALVPPQNGPLLAIALRKRILGGAACGAVTSTEIAQATYAPTAMSFDGRHVSMRFAFAGDPADAELFPPDARFEVDLDAGPAAATLRFLDRDWSGALALTLQRTAPAAVGAGW
jgi:hypothetical protein